MDKRRYLQRKFKRRTVKSEFTNICKAFKLLILLVTYFSSKIAYIEIIFLLLHPNNIRIIDN